MAADASTWTLSSAENGFVRGNLRGRAKSLGIAMVRIPSRLLQLCREHPVFTVVLALAVIIRLLVMYVYANAFYFPDSVQYADLAKEWTPDPVRLFGYSFALKPFVPPSNPVSLPFVAEPYETIALVQHGLVLGLIVAGYVFLVRWGVARWLAALAMVPVALDGRELTMEHHVASETLFIVLLAAGLMVLARSGRLSTVAACFGAVLIAGAAMVRAVGLPVVCGIVVYLALRRVGWRPVLGFASVSGLLLFGYMAYYHHHHGIYAFGESQGRALAARASSIADCDRLVLTPEQRAICPTDPAWRHLQRTDAYGAPNSPIGRLRSSREDDPFLGEFARTVIQQQFGDYLRVVAVQSAWHFLPTPPVDELGRCVIKSWHLPSIPNLRCQARMYTHAGPVPDEALVPVPATKSTTALARYSDVMVTPGPLLVAGAGVAFAAAVWRRRRDTAGRGLTAALFAGAGLGLVVISVATAMFEMRYLLPALFLIPVGAALGIQQIRSASGRTADSPDGSDHEGGTVADADRRADETATPARES